MATLRFKLIAITGNVAKLQPSSNEATQNIESEFFVSAHVYYNDLPSTDGIRFLSPFLDFARCCSRYSRQVKSQSSNNFVCTFGTTGELMDLNVRYKDLPLSAKLLFLVHAIEEPQQPRCVAYGLIPLFDSQGFLLAGDFKVVLIPLEGESVPGNLSRASDPLSQLPRCTGLTKIERIVHPSSVVQTHTKAAREQLAQLLNEEVSLRVIFPTIRTCFSPSVPLTQTRINFRTFHDPDIGIMNPAEKKHIRLTSSRKLYEDANIKPTTDEKALLNSILAKPPTQKLSQAEKDILWKFRVYLSSFKKGLVKFLKSVDWMRPAQVKIAESLLYKWEVPDVGDALEMLSKEFAHHKFIRKYAVQHCLKEIPDDKLQHYLLQLVQALRYEHSGSPLLEFLIHRSLNSFNIASYTFWYLSVEADDTSRKDQSLYYNLLCQFKERLNEEDKSILENLARQETLVSKLRSINQQVRSSGLGRQTQVKRALDLISDHLRSFEQPVHLPLNPSVVVKGALPSVHIFKSANAPMKFDFDVYYSDSSSIGKEYSLIFKAGDDLRQDQLVMQLIMLFDKLLKEENLDLKFVPYHVLATSKADGLLEFVRDAQNLANISDIQKYLQKHNPDADAAYGIAPAALDNFVKSCAGYCVATYVLGIGDRHLDNILLCKTGHCFHIDFGYILGRDPKIGLASPVRLTKGMIDAMGGHNSEHYKMFVQLCCEAFNIIRKSATLIVNLLALMMDAGIAQIRSERDLLEVENRLHLSLSDNEAAQKFQALLAQSVDALGPKMAEFLHSLAKIKIYD